MATKINTDFYGAESSFVTLTPNTKYSPYTIQDLVTRGVYDGGSLDATASPWGIGRSSMSSQFAFFPTKGAEWKIFDVYNDKGNTPLYMMYSRGARDGYTEPWSLTGAAATNANYTKAVYKDRTSPHTTINNDEIRSTLPLDNNARIDLTDTTKLVYLTYLNYQKIRIYPYWIFYIAPNSTTIQNTTLDRIINHSVSVDYIVGIFWGTIDKDASGASITYSVGSYELPIPQEFKDCYYTNDDTWVRPWRGIGGVGHWDYGGNTLRFTTFGSELDVPYSSEFESPNPNDPVKGYQAVTGYGTMSRHNQVFDDVSYHWEYGILPQGADFRTDSPIETGDTYSSGSYYAYSLMKLDGEYDDKNLAFANAILHELAFLGLPFATTLSNARQNIGDNNVYLPVFDDHMITTGNFKSGSESLNLPNAIWNDIFSDTMPEYDPEFDPDPPTPPEPDDDYGYLNNKPVTNRVYSSNNRVYALTAAQYSQFINDVNSLYLDDPDTGYASFQLDFKGTNPSDYIVGTYGYTFLPAGLIPNQQPEPIQIGAVTLPNAEGYKIAPSYIYNYKSLGEIDLTGAGDFKPFGDFRDFEPYTHIELYIPLCGNIELDPATVVGHTIQIEIIFDIMTGNASACVYRDNKTLIATVAGQLAASLPLSSARMGDYQNAVKSAENALKQNELKTTTAAASVAIGVGAALLAPETSGLSLAAYGTAMTGGASLMSLSNQKNQIEYEIKHKQPTISVCSSANGAVAQNISSMYAVCYVKQCKMLSSYNAATYAHTVGYATVKNTTIGAETTDDSNSLIVCSNADLSGIPATAAEINAIQSLLTGGIYV